MSEEIKSEEELSYSEKRKKEASKKRHKEERTFSILAVIIYSVILLLVAAGSYVGAKFGISYYKEKQEAAAIEAELKAAEEQQVSQETKDSGKEEPETIEEEQKDENPEEDDKWKDLTFARLENVDDPANALINTYDFTRIEVENEFGKTLNYSIFTSPETGKIEKIETSENCGDLFQITDYYYYDDKVNYVAEFSQAVDLPVNVASADIESRYYYTNDKLVKYIYCENNKGIEYSLEDKSKYSKGVLEQLDYTSKEVLEKANSTLENAKSGKQQAYIEGYVLDEYNTTLGDRPVLLIEESTGRIAQETKTNGDGKYSFTVLPNELKTYTVRAELLEDNYTDVYGITIPKGSKCYNVPNIYLCYPEQTIPFTVQIFVKDANDANKPLENADIRFRYGLNARSGDVFMTGNLGEFGYIAPQLRSGDYTCEVTKEGYETLYFNLIVKVDHLAVVEYAVKELSEGEIKAVLSWEINPLDIDFKCFSSNQKNVFLSSVDSVGSINAEVIDIKNAGTDAYAFYVSDFTNIAIDNYMGYSLTESMAAISVYNSEGPMGNYYVPAAHAGAVWKPFEIRNGKIIPVNDYFLGLGQDSVFKTKR